MVPWQITRANLTNSQIERYLADKKINATKVDDQVYVEVAQQGNGPKADSGKYVGIKYTGTLLESGKSFDSNTDSTKQTFKHGMEPFYFVPKVNGAIMGMLSGITAFNQGGKGRIFIPSILGYGPQGNLPAIGPNEKLIFDVEVVDVKDSVPPMPGMAHMPSRDEMEKALEKKAAANSGATKKPKK
jgi:FKBP-type peptidyl-prolyl cis-trans isomerase FkpA